MANAGISNPAYFECPVPGNPFRNWYNNTGFDKLADGSEATSAVVSLTQSGGTATCRVTGHTLQPTTFVVIAGANESEYNGFFRVNSVGSPTADDFTFTVDSGAPASATGTITVRRAGFQEKFIDDLDTLGATDFINVLGLRWVQGEANSDNGGIEGEYDYFRQFLRATYDWVRATLATSTKVTIDSNFTIAVCLTAFTGEGTPTAATADPATYEAQGCGYVRAKQVRGCERRDWAYFTETVGRPRLDGVHFSDTDLVLADNINSILNRVNVKQDI